MLTFVEAKLAIKKDSECYGYLEMLMRGDYESPQMYTVGSWYPPKPCIHHPFFDTKRWDDLLCDFENGILNVHSTINYELDEVELFAEWVKQYVDYSNTEDPTIYHISEFDLDRFSDDGLDFNDTNNWYKIRLSA